MNRIHLAFIWFVYFYIFERVYFYILIERRIYKYGKM